MTTIALAAAGGAAGSFAGPLGAQLGYAAGSMLGSFLDGAKEELSQARTLLEEAAEDRARVKEAARRGKEDAMEDGASCFSWAAMERAARGAEACDRLARAVLAFLARAD